jgi:nitrate reductase molybdenum cofactor assembly chaperone NarJ/NarW
MRVLALSNRRSEESDMNNLASTLNLLAECFRYPSPGHWDALEKGLKRLPSSHHREQIHSFLNEIRRLSLGAWEELHTRTLDLNPPAAPYVGFQIWGENYQRGEFLSKMNRALMQSDIDADGELPDHLIPVFRYLATVHEPLPELVEVLEPALQRMTAALRNADIKNPYLHLLDAAQALVKQLKKEVV